MIKRWSQRRASRGVAMVEAGILAPIFAMMMMMTIYLGGVYEAKYRTHMLSRYATWSYASNSCSNTAFKPVYDLPQGIKNGGSSNAGDGAATTDQNGNLPPSNNYTSQAQGGTQATSSLLMGHGTSTLTWDYSPTYKFHGGIPKSVTTVSYSVCNEPPPQGMNIFAYLGNILGKVL